MPLDYDAIVDEVAWLKDDPVNQLVREDMRYRWRVVNLDHDPPLADHETRGGEVAVVNSPRIHSMKRALQATMAKYETTSKVMPYIPLGGNEDKFNNMAEAVEPFHILSRARLDDGLKVTQAVRDHLLIASYGVSIMDFEPAGTSPFPFSVHVPAPDTCYFPEQETYPCVPTVMARSYRMLVRDIVAKYSGQKRTEFDGAQLYLGTSSGKFDWHGMGVDRPVDGWDGSGNIQRGLNGRYQDAEIRVLYSGGWCYHVAMNIGQDGKTSEGDGMIVWKYPSMTGGVPAVIMSGNISEYRGRKRLLPGLYDVMQTTALRNLINTVRLTRSRNLKPDMFISWDKEVWESVKEAGFARPATDAEITAGGPKVIQGPEGTPYWWEMPKDEDLAALEEKVWAEEHEYIQQIQAITNHETAERSTAHGLLLVSGNVEDQQTNWLNQTCFMWTEFAYMQEIALTGHDPRLWVDDKTEQRMLIQKPAKPYLDATASSPKLQLYGKPGLSYSGGELVQGKSYSVTYESLNFGHEIVTETSSQTAERRRAALEDAARRHELYGAPIREMYESQGYSDISALEREMAAEEADAAAGAAHIGVVSLMMDKALELSAGVNITALKQLAAQMAMPPGGAAAPGGASSPMTEGVTRGAVGGSGG